MFAYYTVKIPAQIKTKKQKAPWNLVKQQVKMYINQENKKQNNKLYSVNGLVINLIQQNKNKLSCP
jgi:hypothetical protein